MAVRHDADPKALIAARKREAAKPGRQKLSGRGSGLTPKIRRAIELMVFGDDASTIIDDNDAAAAVGLKTRSLREALTKPAVDAYYRQQVTVKRSGLKALGLKTIEGVMTDPELKKTAAGARVRVDAAKVVLIDQTGTQVNVQVNNNLSVTPGYVLDLRPDEPVKRFEEDDFITIDAVATGDESDG